MHTVPDFFRRKSPEHIVCKLFLSADSILNDFIGRILQMDFHMLPVLLVGFPGNQTSVFKHLQCRGDMRLCRLADSDDIGCSPIRRIVVQKHENVVFHLAKLVFLAYGRHQNLVISCDGLVLIPEVHVRPPSCTVLFRTVLIRTL